MHVVRYHVQGLVGEQWEVNAGGEAPLEMASVRIVVAVHGLQPAVEMSPQVAGDGLGQDAAELGIDAVGPISGGHSHLAGQGERGIPVRLLPEAVHHAYSEVAVPVQVISGVAAVAQVDRHVKEHLHVGAWSPEQAGGHGDVVVRAV